MRPGGGHSKGASFEREIARRISLWLTSGERDDCLWRTAMSGGRATVRIAKGHINRSQVGDLGAIDPVGETFSQHVYVECKFNRDLDIVFGLTSAGGKLCSYWHRAATDAEQAGREPWLVARQNRTATLLLTTEKSANHFDFAYGPSFVIRNWESERDVLAFVLDPIIPPIDSW